MPSESEQSHLEDDAHRLFLDLLKRGAEIRTNAKRVRERANEARDVSQKLARLKPKHRPGT
jgi:hypothetical protein